MEVMVNLRVVRGPDWMWRDQDGGEGHVGTVVQVEVKDRIPDPASNFGGSDLATPPPPKAAVVQWECGKHYRCRYRCGAEGKYDLRVLDCAQAGLKHPGMTCNWCLEDIYGMLWKCSNCYDYYLCTSCYMAGKHSVVHSFERIEIRDKTKRTQLGPRYCARVATAWGIFPGAEVVRGNDWRWGDQDGGSGRSGKVISIKQWDDEAVRNIAEVQWRDTGINNVYRIALGGKVDVKCKLPASGGSYYPDHLPMLGAPCIQPQPMTLSSGDVVTIAVDPDVFKIAQEEHGGWDDIMAEFIGRDGVVTALHDYGDVVVRYSNNKLFELNPEVLTKVDTPHFTYGEVVKVLDDIAVVHQLQKGHGEWDDDMALALGQVGRVLKVKANGDVRVAVNGERWIYNPRCLVSAPGESPVEEYTGKLHVDMRVKLHLHSLAEANCPDVVVTAAATGDVDALTSYLKKNPHEVNTKMEDNTALHAAVVEAFIPVVKAILQFHPDLEIEDENGERPLHLCAYNNCFEAARLLVDAGADVNARDGRGTTPLAVAAGVGHCEVLKVLIGHPNARLNVQNSEGKTPLHGAMMSMRRRSVVMLLEAGANPTLLNFRLQTPFHNAAGFGFLAGMEELVKRYPQHINITKDDGYTPLHVAAANGHADIVALLASHHACDVNIKTKYEKLTPLHIAVHEGYIKTVEFLVGFGADLNAVTTDGNTPLHLALGRGTMRPPSEETPEIKELEDDLARVHGSHTLSPNVIVGFFLVREGSELYIKNKKGVSPLQIRPPDVSTLLGNFLKDHRPSLFHGSLRSSINPFADLPPIYHVNPRKEEPASPVVHTIDSQTQGRHPALKVGRDPSASGEAGRAQSSTPSTPPTAGHALNREAQLAKAFSKDDGKSPINIHHKDINKYTDKSSIPMPSLATAAADIQTPCFLCEDPADVKFMPCGDVVMCSSCAERAKKCPKCRAPVHNFLPVCAICRKEKAIRTYTPCGHKYCNACAAESTRCLLCHAR